MLGAINRLIGRKPRRPNAALLALTLNNMTQGVVLLDTRGRLIVCNEQYRAMYRLSPEIVKPGAALIDMIRSRIDSGSLRRDAQEYCDQIMTQIAAGQTVSFINDTPDGRAISVVNRPIAGTNYWVGTHDDITERRQVERRNVLLDGNISLPTWFAATADVNFRSRSSRRGSGALLLSGNCYLGSRSGGRSWTDRDCWC